jgi:hypothetical protein
MTSPTGAGRLLALLRGRAERIPAAAAGIGPPGPDRGGLPPVPGKAELIVPIRLLAGDAASRPTVGCYTFL